MQTLQTVLFGTKTSFIKATIYTRDLEAFKALGFVENDSLLADDNVEEKVQEKPKIGWLK